MLSPEDPHEPLTTSELISKLDALEVKRSKERHDANSRVMTAILETGLESEKLGDRVGKVESAIQSMAEDLKELTDSMSPFADLAHNIKVRLMGDPEMKTTGLIAEQEQLKESIDTRLSAIESKGEQTFREQRVAIWGAATTFITTVGLIIVAWLNLKK